MSGSKFTDEFKRDAVMAIFIKFTDPDLRDDIFAGTVCTLRLCGLILVHVYTPAQLEFGTG